MARDVGCTVVDLMQDEKLREHIEIRRYVTEKTGLPTLQDILQELAKPGRDPRRSLRGFPLLRGLKRSKISGRE